MLLMQVELTFDTCIFFSHFPLHFFSIVTFHFFFHFLSNFFNNKEKKLQLKINKWINKKKWILLRREVVRDCGVGLLFVTTFWLSFETPNWLIFEEFESPLIFHLLVLSIMQTVKEKLLYNHSCITSYLKMTPPPLCWVSSINGNEERLVFMASAHIKPWNRRQHRSSSVKSHPPPNKQSWTPAHNTFHGQ